MSQVNLEDLTQVKQWAVGALEQAQRRKKQAAMMQLMMGAMQKATQPAIEKVLDGPTKEAEKSLKALEDSNAGFESKMQEAIVKMDAALAEERRKTELLRTWLKELGG